MSGKTTLYDLHRIIQVAMGWTNSHLHQFILGDEYYSIPSEEDWQPVKDERRCLKGKRACPPENVGEMWGFGEFLKAALICLCVARRQVKGCEAHPVKG